MEPKSLDAAFDIALKRGDISGEMLAEAMYLQEFCRLFPEWRGSGRPGVGVVAERDGYVEITGAELAANDREQWSALVDAKRFPEGWLKQLGRCPGGPIPPPAYTPKRRQ